MRMVGALLLVCLFACRAQADAIQVQPTCYRSDGQEEFWVHVRQAFTYQDGPKKVAAANLLHIRCRFRDDPAPAWRCQAIKVDLGKATLSFMNVGTLAVTVERHKGNLTVLEWGDHTITVRWDKGIVETNFDRSSPVGTVYEPATCGKSSIKGEVMKDSGATWIWGSSN